jgi:hypothetical protein
LVHAESTSSKAGHRWAIFTSNARSRPSIGPCPSAPRGDKNGERGEIGEDEDEERGEEGDDNDE